VKQDDRDAAKTLPPEPQPPALPETARMLAVLSEAPLRYRNVIVLEIHMHSLSGDEEPDGQ
jgi:hypothetical protein